MTADLIADQYGTTTKMATFRLNTTGAARRLERFRSRKRPTDVSVASANLLIVRPTSPALNDDPTAFPSQDGGAIGAVALDRRMTAYDHTAATAFQRRIFQPIS